MENYRTFVGVPVKVGDTFLRAREEMIHDLEGERISWVDPNIYHVTIRFIGDTNSETLETIRSSLRKHMKIPAPTRVSLGQVGSFGPRKRPRVVWVGFQQSGLFNRLKTGVDHSLMECGIPPADQHFRAHLTLGRVRSLNNTQRYYDTIEAMKIRFSQSVFLNKLVFYRSELGSGGPVYTPLEELIFRD